jgi:hypothetical protein
MKSVINEVKNFPVALPCLMGYEANDVVILVSGRNPNGTFIGTVVNSCSVNYPLGKYSTNWGADKLYLLRASITLSNE